MIVLVLCMSITFIEMIIAVLILLLQQINVPILAAIGSINSDATVTSPVLLILDYLSVASV